MDFVSIEEEALKDFLNRSYDERDFSQWLAEIDNPFSIVMAEGFEERTIGILEKIEYYNCKISSIVIGRYIDNPLLNKKYRARIEQLAEKIAPNRWFVIENHNAGLWVSEAINKTDTNDVLIDITSISNRGLFGALDSANKSDKNIFIGYTEADIYWPRKKDWEQLKEKLTANENIAEIVDTKPWLFGYEQFVELIPDHEGYDSAGCNRALVGFLSYKYARLAAIVGADEYSQFLFIAGRPRLSINAWRLDALKDINKEITKNRELIEMDTFAYRNAIAQFSSFLFSDDSLLQKYDVHLAILGSKLQTVACWVLSNIIRSITVVTSVPPQYFSESFSEGIGASWVFQLIPLK